MNKIKLTICAAICALCTLSSCGDVVKDEHIIKDNSVVHRVTYSNNSKSYESFQINKITYEGHEYLYVREKCGYAGYFGITHSGNCPCHKNQ